MRVELKVVVDIAFLDEDLGDPVRGDPLEYRMAESAKEAVVGALRFAEGEGFVHDMDNITSVDVKRVKMLKPVLKKGPKDWEP